jgi:hypothetical protein
MIKLSFETIEHGIEYSLIFWTKLAKHSKHISNFFEIESNWLNQSFQLTFLNFHLFDLAFLFYFIDQFLLIFSDVLKIFLFEIYSSTQFPIFFILTCFHSLLKFELIPFSDEILQLAAQNLYSEDLETAKSAIKVLLIDKQKDYTLFLNQCFFLYKFSKDPELESLLLEFIWLSVVRSKDPNSMIIQMLENHFFELLISISKLCPNSPTLIDLVLKSGVLDPILFQILRNIINYVSENQFELIVPFMQQRLQSEVDVYCFECFSVTTL